MDTAVEFHNVSKRFTLYHERPRSLQEAMINLVRPKQHDGEREDFWALRDVTFAIERGKTVGLVGTNGSGKSTALKLVAGILQPSAGEITVRGRVSALLELGTGMHPELTGRENIFLNGSLLGLSNSEVQDIYPHIIEFSELERFIDMPVKHYSSGMYMRLGFSVAIHVRPDILLLDEVMAVGDQSFQNKCLDRIYQMRKQGATVVIVSHGLDQLENMCDELIWLNRGELLAHGSTGSIASKYRVLLHGPDARLSGGPDNLLASQSEMGATPAGPLQRWGSHEVEITGITFRREKEVTTTFRTGEPMTIEIAYHAHNPIEDPMVGIAIHHRDGSHICGPNNKFARRDFGTLHGRGVVTYTIPDLPLLEGNYELSASIYDAPGIHCYDTHWRSYDFEVQPGGSSERYGLFRMGGDWKAFPEKPHPNGSTHAPEGEPVLHHPVNGR